MEHLIALDVEVSRSKEERSSMCGSVGHNNIWNNLCIIVDRDWIHSMEDFPKFPYLNEECSFLYY